MAKRGERFPAKQKLTQEDFLYRAKEIHGDKYNYENSIYIGYRNKIDIICDKHGVFNQVAASHLSGDGCRQCYTESRRTWSDEQEDFLKKNFGKRGFKSSVIAEKLGKTQHAVLVHARRLGLSKLQTPFAGDFPRHVWNNTRKRARIDKIEIDITEEYLNSILIAQDYTCALSGKKLIASSDTKLNNISVDRIDSNKGYIVGNIQIVDRVFNVLKWNHKEIDLIEMCESVAKHLRKRYSKVELEWDIMNDTEKPIRVFSENPVLEQDLHKKLDDEDLF